MKISKLFHWLYGFLMFMPILAVLTNCLVLIFNENIGTSLPNNFDVTTMFYYSVDQVSSNVLFSWCNTSFLVAPFEYIGNLFGMPVNSPLYTFFSYWLNISLIWLVFDVIMYVPLLVHRWLDKGVIE